MVSVIVVTYNRPDDLVRCVCSILTNTYPSFELIVVDHSESDDTGRALAHLHDQRLTYVHVQGGSKPSCLNLALQHAHGQMMLLTDDDCEVGQRWVQRAVEVLDHESTAGIVYGALTAAPHDPLRTYVPKFAPAGYRRFGGRLSRANYFGKGANMAVRRSVYERVGGYDPAIGPGAPLPGADDTDLAYRAVTAGFEIVEDPENVVTHWGARDYATGAALRYISTEFRAMGGCYTRIALRGDPVGVYLIVRDLAALTLRAASNVLRGRRPFGARHLAAFIQGVAIVLRYGRKGGPERVQLGRIAAASD